MSHLTTNKQPGSRDETWGPDNDGRLSLYDVFKDQLDSTHTLLGALLLGNGDLLVASETEAKGYREFLIAKLNAFGERDQHFGEKGFVTGGFAPGTPAFSGEMTQGKDGRIYMFGVTGFVSSPDPEIAILCIDETGKRVESFGNNGQIIIENKIDERVFYGERRFIRVLEDGDLLIGTNGATGSARVETAYVMRFDANGNPVNTFGKDGVVDIKLPNAQATTYLTSGCTLSDGRILIAGYARPDGSTKSAMLAMLNPGGSPNLIFGDKETPGMRLITKPRFEIEFNAVTVREAGKYMAAGSDTGPILQHSQGLLVGFDDHGNNDPDFNSGTVLETSLRPGHETNWDNIFVQGQHVYVAGGISGHYILLLGLNGQANPIFGNGGLVEENNTAFTPAFLMDYSSDRLLLASNGPGLDFNQGTVYRYYRA
ncbi:hypothetical protein ACIP1X_09655 [Pseudomonas sp. NPDC088885]|uniref:hypothetical protein n=1 Tax=Pseudomonas sp. NPDC088885 TaxID=3364457 RepID=UPI0038029941